MARLTSHPGICEVATINLVGRSETTRVAAMLWRSGPCRPNPPRVNDLVPSSWKTTPLTRRCFGRSKESPLCIAVRVARPVCPPATGYCGRSIVAGAASRSPGRFDGASHGEVKQGMSQFRDMFGARFGPTTLWRSDGPMTRPRGILRIAMLPVQYP